MPDIVGLFLKLAPYNTVLLKRDVQDKTVGGESRATDACASGLRCACAHTPAGQLLSWLGGESRATDACASGLRCACAHT